MQQLQNGKSVYELGLAELHRVSQDDGARKSVESDFMEARGRETARLHVTLRAMTEQDLRAAERARATLEALERLSAELQDRAAQLSHLIESFEQMADKRFSEIAQLERQNFDATTAQVATFQRSSTTQVDETKTALWKQADTNFSNLSTQGRESTERLAQDVRQTRDELVRLVDSRLNQADASFAALRGDLEVVKFLVMDIIKSRIGRVDPAQKPY